MHIYPPRDREHTPEAAAAFRTVRSECFELPGLGLVTLRLLTIPLPIRVSRPPTRAYSWAPFELSSVSYVLYMLLCVFVY